MKVIVEYKVKRLDGSVIFDETRCLEPAEHRDRKECKQLQLNFYWEEPEVDFDEESKNRINTLND